MRTAMLGLLLASGPAMAAAPENATVLNSSRLPDIDVASSGIDVASLGHAAARTVPGARVDLNGDGAPDLLLRGGPTFCGTGGCTFFLFDGRTLMALGTVFGSTVIVTKSNINGWPVLATFARGGATSGSFATFVHDGQQYLRVTAVELRTESVTDLFNSLATEVTDGQR